MKNVSIGEIALKLGINKSKLAYFYSLGLLKSNSRVGKTNVFELDSTIKKFKKIEELKKKGKTLKEIKKLLN